HRLQYIADRILALLLELDLRLRRHLGGDISLADKLARGDPLEIEILLGKLLQTFRPCEIAPLGGKERDRLMLPRDIGLNIGDLAFGSPGCMLERIENEGGDERRENKARIEESQHDARCPAKRGTPSALRSSGNGGASVRSAARSFAERALGFAAISSRSASR